MKRILSATAVALALGTTAAYADVQTSFPDGYTIVVDSSRGAQLTEAQLPQPSFVDYTILSADEASDNTSEATSEGTSAVYSAETLQSFPQPSFTAG